MDSKKFTARLNDYYERLEKHKARPIETCHVMEILRKLEAKEAQLQAKLGAAHKQDKRERITARLKTVGAQISRARHLLQEVETAA
ncbi:hypothetical protein [Aliiruegeria sabulilitoris]|uniref:hypothetical protein n=1 Tax=Aliiruegeria sabulilitoris TaxID=1510458 RepID=UPI00082AB245|nr:hypothetical protein [Aliiruegeria sabulilitoris]NDR58779.1 hypothetical protein [Pseudoruegeria sp. M32A2M]